MNSTTTVRSVDVTVTYARFSQTTRCFSVSERMSCI